MASLIGMLRSLVAVAGLATMLAAVPAQAAPRFWLLENVSFSDGAIATGYFVYDDITSAVSAWNISVSPGADAAFFPFTFMPGNSTANALAVWTLLPTISFSAPDAGTAAEPRVLRLTPTQPMDGSPATVALAVAVANSNLECMGCNPFRTIAAGSLRHVPNFAFEVTTVEVIEYYHAGLDHYFITADATEIQKLDAGSIPGWTRTGHSFQARRPGYPPGTPSNLPVCRFIGLPEAGINSHFYSGIARECRDVHLDFVGAWAIEAGNVFQIALPTPAGACAAGTTPVWRFFNNKLDANHRYTTNAVVRTEMIAAGWIPEGFGATGVVMCAILLI